MTPATTSTARPAARRWNTNSELLRAAGFSSVIFAEQSMRPANLYDNGRIAVVRMPEFDYFSTFNAVTVITWLRGAAGGGAGRPAGAGGGGGGGGTGEL